MIISTRGMSHPFVSHLHESRPPLFVLHAVARLKNFHRESTLPTELRHPSFFLYAKLITLAVAADRRVGQYLFQYQFCCNEAPRRSSLYIHSPLGKFHHIYLYMMDYYKAFWCHHASILTRLCYFYFYLSVQASHPKDAVQRGSD